MITPEEIIQRALGSNQDIIKRRKSQIDSSRLGVPSVPGANEHAHVSEEGLVGPYKLEPGLWDIIQTLQRINPWGPDAIGVTSGWRSYEEQARLRARYERGEGPLAARPGHSNHNRGYAADLNYASDEVRDWVHQMGQQLGYHFPVSGEDWHIERIR